MYSCCAGARMPASTAWNDACRATADVLCLWPQAGTATRRRECCEERSAARQARQGPPRALRGLRACSRHQSLGRVLTTALLFTLLCHAYAPQVAKRWEAHGSSSKQQQPAGSKPAAPTGRRPLTRTAARAALGGISLSALLQARAEQAARGRVASGRQVTKEGGSAATAAATSRCVPCRWVGGPPLHRASGKNQRAQGMMPRPARPPAACCAGRSNTRCQPLTLMRRTHKSAARMLATSTPTTGGWSGASGCPPTTSPLR